MLLVPRKGNTMKKMHKMPNGKMMEGAKHEKTEGAKERMKEYGSKKAGAKPSAYPPKKKK